MARISRHVMLMAQAKIASFRSTCNRLRVGALISNCNRPLSIGYNGAPAGMPHCSDDCGPGRPCKNTIHAEENAINWALTFGRSLVGSTMYVTHAPCVECAKLIVKHGIGHVIYCDEYRLRDGVDYLVSNGVKVEKCQVSVAISVDCASSPAIQE